LSRSSSSSLLENKLRKVVLALYGNKGDPRCCRITLFVVANLNEGFTRGKESLVYSSKTYLPDFFQKINSVVEIKLCDSL